MEAKKRQFIVGFSSALACARYIGECERHFVGVWKRTVAAATSALDVVRSVRSQSTHNQCLHVTRFVYVFILAVAATELPRKLSSVHKQFIVGWCLITVLLFSFASLPFIWVDLYSRWCIRAEKYIFNENRFSVNIRHLNANNHAN